MKTYLLLLIGIIFCLTSCKKDKDKKPVARLDIFECKVNGQLWLPEVSNAWIENKLESSYQSGVFSVSARKKRGLPNPISEKIYYSGYFFTTGEYELTGWPHDMSFSKILDNSLHIFRTDSLHTGKVTITKVDTVAGIIAGTFYFDAIDTTTNEVVHITEGKFDVKY